MIDAQQRIWGFETNFGALAEVSLVRANQLMPMPTHLTWEEAASLSLTLATSYRMLVSPNAASMKQGDVVLIWGATGGLGGFAVQLVLNGGGILSLLAAFGAGAQTADQHSGHHQDKPKATATQSRPDPDRHCPMMTGEGRATPAGSMPHDHSMREGHMKHCSAMQTPDEKGEKK
jgi:hypothetical protein